MANDPKKARVRWEKNEATGEEQYFLETWNWDEGRWEVQNQSGFVADADSLGGPKDFIHYSLLVDAIILVNQGYEIDI